MIVGVPVESYPGERRVALVPGVVAVLAKAGLEVHIEAGAGEKAGFPDAAYLEQGAHVAQSRGHLFPRRVSWLRCTGLIPPPPKLAGMMQICSGPGR